MSSSHHSKLSIEQRKQEIINDSSRINPDMLRNFNNYPIWIIKFPLLIFYAMDDKIASYERMKDVIFRFPNCTFITFETVGHLLVGHE